MKPAAVSWMDGICLVDFVEENGNDLQYLQAVVREELSSVTVAFVWPLKSAAIGRTIVSI